MRSKSADLELSARKPVPDPETKPVLTVPEAADAGTGQSATYEAAQRGQLGPVLRVGRKMFIPTASLDSTRTRCRQRRGLT